MRLGHPPALRGLPAGLAPSAERLDTVAAQHLDRTLRQLARHALLEPETA